MNYYPHHIGDFVRDTARLSDSQCMAYLRMIWMYYENESALEDDAAAIAFKIGADAFDVQQILKHFFFLHEDGLWHQARCDEEILAFRKKSDKAKKSADARWKNANAMRTHSERNANASISDANQEPITTNQEPIDKTLSDANASSSTPSGDDTPKSDPIPFERIKSLYHEILPELRAVQVMNSARKASVRQRHLGVFAKSIDAWEAYFRAVRRSNFLMGRIDGNSWRADFDFLIREASVTKVLEGKYHEQRNGNFEQSRPRATTAAERIAAKRQQLAAQSPDVGVVATHDADVRPQVDEPAGRGTQRYLAAGVV